MTGLVRWAPAGLFTAGAFLLHGLGPQEAVPLRQPLTEVVPQVLDGFLTSEDQEVSRAEARTAGFSDYLMRIYTGPGGSADWASLYVGYYESQTQGQTIHSPKNCLPGSGWEPLTSEVSEVRALDGNTYRVNRYILQRDDEQAVVLYWYQGRGRIAHNEYRVKWDLLRDAALRRRSDEALVRVVVPVTTTEEDAFQRALGVAQQAIPAVGKALPL